MPRVGSEYVGEMGGQQCAPALFCYWTLSYLTDTGAPQVIHMCAGAS